MESANPHRLNRIFAVVSRPAYCKIAGDQSQSADEPCPPAGYADQINKLFPCHTKEAAFVSNVLFLDKGYGPEGLSEDEATCHGELAKFAHFWGIHEDVQKAKEALVELYKKASIEDLADDAFALVQDHGGERVRKYASFDGDSTFDSAVAFYQNRNRYPFAWRKEAAVRLIAKAEAFSTQLPEYVDEYLHKAAGFAIPTEESLDSALVERMNLAPKSAKADIEKIAEVLTTIAETPALRYNNDLVSDTLEVMDRFDRQHKLATHYGERLRLPEEALVHTEIQLSKHAGVSNNFVRLVNGHDVDVTTLEKDALDAVDEKLGHMSHEKLAAVLPTLPKPDADLLVRLCSTPAQS